MLNNEFVISFFVVMLSGFLFLSLFKDLSFYKGNKIDIDTANAFICYEFFYFYGNANVLCIKDVCDEGFKKNMQHKKCKKSYIFH